MLAEITPAEMSQLFMSTKQDQHTFLGTIDCHYISLESFHSLKDTDLNDQSAADADDDDITRPLHS